MRELITKQIGEVIDGLEVQTILRYEKNEPVYGCLCLKCGTHGVPVRHDEFRKGTARCISSLHLHGGVHTEAGSIHGSAQVRENNRVTWSDWRQQEPQAQRSEPQATPDPEAQRREQAKLEDIRQAASRIGVGMSLEEVLRKHAKRS